MPKPNFSLPAADAMRARVLQAFNRRPLTPAALNEAMRILAKYRSHLIQWEMARRSGASIQGRPFAGMQFIDHGSQGCHVPKLLGCYEQELHGFIEAAIATGYPQVVNIGCAEGYYAAGLAKRMAGTRVHAFDIDPQARRMCAEVAQRNGFDERLAIAEEFVPSMFAGFAGKPALFLVDIEGAELALLKGAAPQDVSAFDFLIECHDNDKASISVELAKLLEPTHLPALVRHEICEVELPQFLREVGHLDQLLAVWEWRERPTPWLLAASRERPGTPFWNAVSAAARESARPSPP